MTKKQKRMKAAVEYLQKYINSYSNQSYYLDYEDGILIDDILYGLGMALDPENHKWADGYERFKVVLNQHLDRTKKDSVLEKKI